MLDIICTFVYSLNSTAKLGSGQIGRSYTNFANLKLLYSTWSKEELAHRLASMPCFIALIMSDSFDDAIHFVDYISDLKGNPVKSKKKYLILNTPNIDQSLLQNKTSNFNVHIISHGETDQGGKNKITSLCPTLGKKYSLIRPGMCSSNLQDPRGKEIPVSVVGGEPYVIYNEKKEWIRGGGNFQKWDTYQGTEFQVMDLYANKFGFTPKYIRAKSWDGEGSVIEMVRKTIMYVYCISPSILCGRLIKRTVKLGWGNMP